MGRRIRYKWEGNSEQEHIDFCNLLLKKTINKKLIWAWSDGDYYTKVKVDRVEFVVKIQPCTSPHLFTCYIIFGANWEELTGMEVSDILYKIVEKQHALFAEIKQKEIVKSAMEILKSVK